MKIGILSASGQLGGQTLEAVLEAGAAPEDVAAIARHPAKLSAWGARGVDIRAGDYNEPDLLRTAFRRLDRLLLVPSIVMPAERVRQYDNAIKAARDAGVRHLLHYGLLGTDVACPFLITPFLLYAEAAIRTSGLQWTIFRNSIYADPIGDWLPSIVEMGTIPYPTGDGRCSFVTRNDIARAGAAALLGKGHAGRTYRLTGPEALTTADLCEIAGRVTGRPVEHRPATEDDYAAVCRKEGEPEDFIPVLTSLYRGVREGFFAETSDDIEELTGRPPRKLEEYLRARQNG